ncbi:MAG: hypothetical protein RSC68_11410, partial [Acinetobacter sp.]
MNTTQLFNQPTITFKRTVLMSMMAMSLGGISLSTQAQTSAQSNQQEIEQLKAEKQAIVSEDKPDQMEHESNNETRRKILLGSYLDKKMSAKEANKEKIL